MVDRERRRERVLKRDDIRIMENLKNMILKEHPYFLFIGDDGRWRTHVKDEDAAEGRRLIAKRKKRDLLDAVAEYYIISGNEKYLKKCVSIRTLFPYWLKYKALHTNADTYITRIKSKWDKYYENNPIVDKPVYRLKKLELDEWAHGKIKQYNMTKNMYHNFAIIMRQCLQYAVDMELIETNEYERVRIDGLRMFRKTEKKANRTQVYSKEEVSELFRIAWSDFRNSEKLVHRLAPLAVMFQFLTGLRVGELCAVRYSDIHNGMIHIGRMVRRDCSEIVEHTKTHVDRDVILTDSAIDLIETARMYQKKNGIKTEYIFSVFEEPLRYNEVNILLKRYCARADIPYRSSHKARKTYISALIDAGININTIRESAGHADERTTYFNYCFDRASDEHKRKLVEEALLM